MKTKIIALIITLVLIFPTFSFFLGDKMFTFHDETQIANLHQYFKAIDLGQFPPRWAPDMIYEYGSPFLSFNYQLPYYLGYFGYLAGLPTTVIFKWLLAGSLIIGAGGMFLLAGLLTGSNLMAISAAVFYTYTPFQAIDHYVRGALGESFALALFPWLFWASFSLIKKITPGRIIVLGLLFALLLLSHQPAALFALPLFFLIFALPALFCKRLEVVFALIKAQLLSFLLSAYYIVPVIIEKKFINESSPFNFRDQFPFIRQLIYSSWSYSGANPFSSDTISFQIGLPNLVVLAAAFFALPFLWRRGKDRYPKWLFTVLLVVTFLVIFLMNIRSTFIWEALPLIQLTQFPWRLLMFTTIFTSVFYLLIVGRLRSKLRYPLVFLITLAAIGLNIGYFRPGEVNDYNDAYFFHRFLPRVVLWPGETVSRDYFNHAEDYVPLPKGAVRPKALPQARLTGSSSTSLKVVSANPYRFQAQVESAKGDTLTYAAFNYPGWTVRLDGFPTAITPDSIGAITFPVPAGKHEVIIAFEDTPLRLFSNIISLGSLTFVMSYLIYQLINRHASPAARSPKSSRSRA